MPAVKLAAPAGFRLELVDFETEDGSPRQISAARAAGQPFSILVYAIPDDMIGHADFFYGLHPEKNLMCSDVFVVAEFRRRGLANAMYCAAEQATGKVIHPYSEQYPDGRRLWKQDNRPFGRGIVAPRKRPIRQGS